MTFQTFKSTIKKRLSAIILLTMATASIHAQQPTMQALISQSLAKLRQPTPEAFLNFIAELKRIDAMFPDSIQPKHQMALQSLYFSVMNPHATQTDGLLAEAEQTITRIEQLSNSHSNEQLSDICTLRGFLYMVHIVQNPARNGQRYYIDVMENYEKALKLNPGNQLAKQLQQQFFEGMRQQTGGRIKE